MSLFYPIHDCIVVFPQVRVRLDCPVIVLLLCFFRQEHLEKSCCKPSVDQVLLIFPLEESRVVDLTLGYRNNNLLGIVRIVVPEPINVSFDAISVVSSHSVALAQFLRLVDLSNVNFVQGDVRANNGCIFCGSVDWTTESAAIG